MSMSNATENATLKVHLQGIDLPYRTNAIQYLALVTDVDGLVNEAAPVANECTYTGYARVPLTKATAWIDNGSTFVNANLIQFGKRTDAGATQTTKAFVIVDTISGAVNQAIIGTFTSSLEIRINIQPQFSPGDLQVIAE